MLRGKCNATFVRMLFTIRPRKPVNQKKAPANKINRLAKQAGKSGEPEDSSNQADSASDLKGWDLWKLCDIGDILSVKGLLFKTKKGEPSLKVQDLKILCKSVEPLPEKYHGIENIELKYRFRHLDLIMDQKSKEIFKTRSRVIQEIRNFMNQQDFIEFETPVLQSMYGGAVAEPFETHFRRLDNQKMYLKISPELYLKKLIVGGFEKIYEIGKNFRNEGIDRTHNPEFTMMEYYQAYTDYKDQIQLFKKLVNHVVEKIKGSLKISYQGRELDFNQWEVLPIKAAIKKYSALEYLSPKDQKSLKKALGEDYKNLDPDNISIDHFVKAIKNLDPSGDYKKIEEFLSSNPQDSSLSQDSSILQDSSLSQDPSFPQKRESTNPQDTSTQKDPSFLQKQELKGELIVKAFELLAEKHLWNPTFITDFPLSVSPLTKQHRSEKNLVERFEPYIAGMELGNAYTELNDPIEQKARLLKQDRWAEAPKNPNKEAPEDSKESKNPNKESSEEPQKLDKNFIHALEIGMPPTGGVGLGIERLIMILSDQKSIRDCILFPALKSKT